MYKEFENHFDSINLDIRRLKDARFMDQKVTPDVLSIVADSVVNYIGSNVNVSFTKDDIWNDSYFNKNVKSIFNKPDAGNKTTAQEYDKFTSQPLRTLAFAKILELNKRNNKNYYTVNRPDLLEFIAMRERNAFVFLHSYLTKVLSDSGQLVYFNSFIKKGKENHLTQTDYVELKGRFTRFIIGNTAITKQLEINRIFPKILNIFSSQEYIRGSVKGRLSDRPIYYSDLMYNRPNFRDKNKEKSISRVESESQEFISLDNISKPYSDYLIQKSMTLIKKLHITSEVSDQWSSGEATQVHHIFPKSKFPSIASYLENLIKLTPTQHFSKAHPSNRTDEIDIDYQLVCLLAKSTTIEKSIIRGEFYYRKESFIHVINTGLKTNYNSNLSFLDIRNHLTLAYNRRK